MRIILLSGGSGKRLWPLSNEIRSKLFLKLLPTEEGQRESMIQRACRQLEQAGLLSHTTIVTNRSQVEIIQNQVGEGITILAEPYKRGTFISIGLAASYFYSKVHDHPDEVICVIPADLFVDAEFYNVLSRLPQILAQSGSELALIGTIPNRPSSQYGYIVPQENGKNDYYDVSKFVEKPDEELAASLISDHAFWNCGTFAFSLSFILSRLQDSGLPNQYEELLDCYELFPVTSFDEEVAEKTRHSIVVPYEKTWKDLGDWRVLSNYLGSHVIGKGQISNDSRHTHLINELTYPIHVIGVSNIIVAASPDGILVADKDRSNEIKSILHDSQIPMFEEKRWGTIRVLDHSRTRTDIETLTQKVEILAGKNTSYHSHQKRKEIWTIISGTGVFILEGVITNIQTGDVLQIPYGARHAVKAISPLEIIEVQIGNVLMEDDILRQTMTWEETLKYCSIADDFDPF
ncbi:mannose-1-phosphate guanylyltransferase [Fontibacillus panacisegetis]|uniref:Mannose-1-phosphate guanylyltransferase n=1 Tax=Fontibacillus panacisegetis TaxID=670482 RepID=A0A1G7V4U0_9BACL|nr:sugar phosphate nucleotidyltransferase [Fontibacillus panacisegetis]SDG54389.1 mannose-1-phosphate guanylyltransferase [Fontibacillus panacisegetis]